MKVSRRMGLMLLLSAVLPAADAQESATPAHTGSAVKPPALTRTNDVYHLDTSFSYRLPLNGDYDWWLPATITFGKMLDDRNALDGVFGGGVIRFKHGSAADTQAHQPFFLELGIAWKHYFATREAPVKPYVTAGASVLWMSWEYRHSVDSKFFGHITRDYLEGANGYAGVGLILRLREHFHFFGEVDAGGTGFLSTTHSGEHNHLFENFGYVGFKGGLSLTF